MQERRFGQLPDTAIREGAPTQTLESLSGRIGHRGLDPAPDLGGLAERLAPALLEQAGGAEGECLCFEDEGAIVVVPLLRQRTRIGRSLTADVRFEDPTVSRRHALIVRGVDGLRVLDDRSLNGVFVNGQRVEWSPLAHGDEIRVGRHRLYYATLDPVGAAAPTS
jgi:hypothetical protein